MICRSWETNSVMKNVFSNLRYILLKWIALYKGIRFLEVSFFLPEFQQLHIVRVHLKAFRIFTNLMFYLMVLLSKKVGWRKKDLTIFSNLLDRRMWKVICEKIWRSGRRWERNIVDLRFNGLFTIFYFLIQSLFSEKKISV